jgi:hypothetical protein
MDDNLTMQGYCMSAEERRRLGLGLRFPTGACLALVIVALVLESAPMLLILSGIGAVAGFTARHPFDHLWNGAVRHLAGAPPLPPNPPRRRHAFKIASAWLLGVAVLMATGAVTAALLLGGALVAACSVVTLLNLCLPSLAFELVERYRRRREAAPA